MTDDRPSPEELAAAKALARTLKGEPVQAAPADALQAAGLIELDGQALSAEREAAVWDRIQNRLDPALADNRRPDWRRWLLPVGSLATAAAAVLLVFGLLPATPSATALPRPEVALLRHQAGAAAGQSQAAERLRVDMRTYRADLFARLQDRYGGPP